MYFTLIASLAVLHIATCTPDRESKSAILSLHERMIVCVGITNGVSDCVSQQELGAVKTDMQRQVDELHFQLHYWQNTTIKILKEHYFPSDPGIY